MRTVFRLLIGLTFLALLPAGSMAARPAIRADDMTLGNPRAGVLVVEYASLSCPHCARFHQQVFPAFKKKYVDSGQVQFVYREFLTAPAEIAVPATIIARCAGRAGYFGVVARVFASQDEMYKDGTVAGVHRILRREAAALGLDDARYDACLADQAAFDALKVRLDAAEADGVKSTPTFFVNGKKVVQPVGQEIDLAVLDAAIAAARADR